MPVVAREEESGRKHSRVLTIACGVLLLAALLLPLAPCFTPVALHLGDRWFYAEGAWLSPEMAQMFRDPYYAADPPPDQSATVYSARGGSFTPAFEVWGSYHVRWWHAGRCFYSVEWFRGRRIS